MKKKLVKIPFSLIIKEAGFKTKYFWLDPLIYLLSSVGCLIFLCSCDLQPLTQFLDEYTILAACFFGYLLLTSGFLAELFDILDSLVSAASRLKKQS